MTSGKGRRQGTGAWCYKVIFSGDLVGRGFAQVFVGKNVTPWFWLHCQTHQPSWWLPSYTSGSILTINEMVRRGWEFSLSLIEKAGLRKPKLFFCSQVSISKKLSSEEICQLSDGISGRDQKEMAKLEYQVAPWSVRALTWNVENQGSGLGTWTWDLQSALNDASELFACCAFNCLCKVEPC